ncbi:unnamed protein product [Arctogadus glacialis]
MRKNGHVNDKQRRWVSGQTRQRSSGGGPQRDRRAGQEGEAVAEGAAAEDRGEAAQGGTREEKKFLEELLQSKGIALWMKSDRRSARRSKEEAASPAAERTSRRRTGHAAQGDQRGDAGPPRLRREEAAASPEAGPRPWMRPRPRMEAPAAVAEEEAAAAAPPHPPAAEVHDTRGRARLSDRAHPRHHH